MPKGFLTIFFPNRDSLIEKEIGIHVMPSAAFTPLGARRQLSPAHQNYHRVNPLVTFSLVPIFL